MFRLLFICSLFLLGSCREMNLPPQVSPQAVTVQIQVMPEAVQQITRADDDAITDVNFFLFGINSSQHLYTTTSCLQFDCLPGDYTLYVVANVHADMGALSQTQLAAYTTVFRENYMNLPMAAQQEVNIPATGRTFTLPNVEVKRQVAKISYNIAVGKEASDIVLKTVSFHNIPRKSLLFESGIPSSNGRDYLTGCTVDIPAQSSLRFSGTAYLPENLQGDVASITTQQDKNRDNAPKYATYLLIRAMRGMKLLDYTIFVGENNTSDFNVHRNTSHTIDITILGDNEVDTRVHAYTLSVWDDMEREAIGGWCVIDPQKGFHVDVTGNTPVLDLWGEVEITAGDAENIEFDRESVGNYHTFDVYAPQAKNFYELSYMPGNIVTKDNSLLEFTVTVCDEYDYAQSYDFSHRFANEVRAYVTASNVQNGLGRVTSSGALASEKLPNTENLRALCLDDGCTLTAMPDAGYVFAGWYAESSFKQLLSTEANYAYKPTKFYGALYPRFERDKSDVYIGTSNVEEVHFNSDLGYEIEDVETFYVPYGSHCTISVDEDLLFEGFFDGWNRETSTLLTTQNSYTFTATKDRNIVPHYSTAQNLSATGKANCYIAPKSGTTYCFNASVMGNGRATTGITPRPLNGSRAVVLWENCAYMASYQGAVITEAEYSNGQIFFKTGTEEGNALIGLFDSAGTCIWSWHIWVTSYVPAASAQTYTGGRVFMDRNLGAASTSDPGLYYQWGRKDPFGAYYREMAFHKDYPFDATDPMMGYGEMTLTYSIAHPWTFMCGVAMNDDRYGDTSDWLATQNPNLWGNASTTTNLSEKGSKSIYDPCPPGWRVPDRLAYKEASLSKNTNILSDYYYYMRINISGGYSYYPRGGYLTDSTKYNPDKAAWVWTNAPAIYNVGPYYYKHFSTALKIYPSGIEPLARMSRDRALPVRCVRE